LPAKPYSPSSWIPSSCNMVGKIVTRLQWSRQLEMIHRWKQPLQHLAANATIPNSPVRRTHDASTLGTNAGHHDDGNAAANRSNIHNNRAPLPIPIGSHSHSCGDRPLISQPIKSTSCLVNKYCWTHGFATIMDVVSRQSSTTRRCYQKLNSSVDRLHLTIEDQ
jgi:hypothetical protein